jgi:hypothetical protein
MQELNIVVSWILDGRIRPSRQRESCARIESRGAERGLHHTGRGEPGWGRLILEAFKKQHRQEW